MAQSSIKEDSNKASMNDSSRLSCSGIPKPTAAVKGTAKPTNSVAPMPIVKQKSEIEEKPIASVDPMIEEKEKQKEFVKNVSYRFVFKSHFVIGTCSRMIRICCDFTCVGYNEPFEAIVFGRR